MKAVWEKFEGDLQQEDRTTERLPVPGGWLVRVLYNTNWHGTEPPKVSGLVFVADSAHSWGIT